MESMPPESKAATCSMARVARDGRLKKYARDVSGQPADCPFQHDVTAMERFPTHSLPRLLPTPKLAACRLVDHFSHLSPLL